MAPKTCVNCNKVFEGNYCPDCGQKADVSPNSFKFLIESISNEFNLDRGIVVTCIHLFIKPTIVFDHLKKGNTTKYTNPVRLLLTVIAFYSFLGFMVAMLLKEESEKFLELNTYLDVLASLISIWISTFLINRKYASFVICGLIATYNCCQVLLITIVASFLFLLGVRQSVLFEFVFVFIFTIYSIWFALRIYSLRWIRALLLSFSSCVIFVLIKLVLALSFNL